jgi:hypothetical protein
MEIDSRRIRRLIEKSRTRERVLNRFIRSQAWLDPVAEAVQKRGRRWIPGRAPRVWFGHRGQPQRLSV